MYYRVGDKYSYGGLFSLDLPLTFLSLKTGLEAGWLNGVAITSRYPTLDGIPASEVTKKQSNFFWNVRLVKYFDAYLYPYIGGAMGASDRNFVRGVTVFSGINFPQFEMSSFYVSMELRSGALNVESDLVKFSKFGDSATSVEVKQVRYYGAVMSLNYVF